MLESGMPARRLAAALIGVLFASLVVGCAANRAYKQGQELEEKGKPYRAATKYLAALEHNENHEEARTSLSKVASDAYSRKMSVVEEQYEKEKFEEALGELRGLEAFVERVRRYVDVGFSPEDVEKEIVRTRKAGARKRYAAGERARRARRWQKAIAKYRSAVKFAPGESFRKSDRKIALCHYNWGQQLLDTRSYRQAAQQFANAGETVSGYRDAVDRAAELYAALGRDYLERRRCRRAVEDLRRAVGLVSTAEYERDLSAARACATETVALLPFQGAGGRQVDGRSIEKEIARRTRSALDERASKFIELASRAKIAALDVAKERAARGQPGEFHRRLRGLGYLVVGEFERIRIENRGEQTSTETVTGEEGYECTKRDEEGEPYATTCYREVRVVYETHELSSVAELEATIRVTEIRSERSNRQIASKTIDVSARDSARWADGFRVQGRQVSISKSRERGSVEVPDEIWELSRVSPDVLTAEALADRAMERWSRKGVDFLLETIDRPSSLDDPARLDVSFGEESAAAE